MTDADRIKRLAEWLDKPYNIGMAGGVYIMGCPLAWNPLVNIQDAWMLVEKAIQQYDFHLAYDCVCRMWRAYLLHTLPPSIAEADTAPLAICAAIEKLMEIK